MRVVFPTDSISFFLSDAKLVCCGVGIDCSHVVQFTAHFADLDLLNHYYSPVKSSMDSKASSSNSPPLWARYSSTVFCGFKRVTVNPFSSI